MLGVAFRTAVDVHELAAADAESYVAGDVGQSAASVEVRVFHGGTAVDNGVDVADKLGFVGAVIVVLDEQFVAADIGIGFLSLDAALVVAHQVAAHMVIAEVSAMEGEGNATETDIGGD